MSVIDDFKAFAFKGNVVDLAVGTIIGAGFGKIVSGLVDNMIMPIVATVMPNPDWKNKGIVLKEVMVDGKAVTTELKWGAFVGSILDFLILALVLFMLVSAIQKAMAAASAKAAAAKKLEDDKKAEEDKKKAEAEAAAAKVEETLLTEIRDLLKAQAAKA